MPKDNRPKANPFHCVQYLEAYFEIQFQLKSLLPDAIEALRKNGGDASIFIADRLEKHNEALEVFHQNYLPLS